MLARPRKQVPARSFSSDVLVANRKSEALGLIETGEHAEDAGKPALTGANLIWRGFSPADHGLDPGSLRYE